MGTEGPLCQATAGPWKLDQMVLGGAYGVQAESVQFGSQSV